jgi:hypothetical protein
LHPLLHIVFVHILGSDLNSIDTGRVIQQSNYE